MERLAIKGSAVVFFLLLHVSPVWPWNEPSDFRGVPFGASEKTLQEKFHGMRCSNVPPEDSWTGDRFCYESGLSIGGVEATVDYTFRQDRLVSAGVLFKSRDFAEMEDIFVRRYGRPTKTEETRVKTGGGVEATNRTHTWQGKKIVILLVRYAETITDSAASLTTIEERKESLRLKNERRGKAAEKDL